MDLIGLNFDMSFGNNYQNNVNSGLTGGYVDPKLKLLSDKLTAQYPTGDCIKIDQSIAAIQIKIDEYLKEQIGGYKIAPYVNNGNYSQFQAYKQKYNDRVYEVDNSLIILKARLQDLKTTFITQNCRDSISDKRQEDISSIFATTSAKQENQVLTNKSNVKQYIIVGSAAIILLVSLKLILKK